MDGFDLQFAFGFGLMFGLLVAAYWYGEAKKAARKLHDVIETVRTLHNSNMPCGHDGRRRTVAYASFTSRIEGPDMSGGDQHAELCVCDECGLRVVGLGQPALWIKSGKLHRAVDPVFHGTHGPALRNLANQWLMTGTIENVGDLNVIQVLEAQETFLVNMVSKALAEGRMLKH